MPRISVDKVSLDESTIQQFYPDNVDFHHFRLRHQVITTTAYTVRVAACRADGSEIQDLHVSVVGDKKIDFTKPVNPAAEVIIEKSNQLDKARFGKPANSQHPESKITELIFKPELYQHPSDPSHAYEYIQYKVKLKRKKI